MNKICILSLQPDVAEQLLLFLAEHWHILKHQQRGTCLEAVWQPQK